MGDANRLLFIDRLRGVDFVKIQSALDNINSRDFDFSRLRIELLRDEDCTVIDLSHDVSRERFCLRLQTGDPMSTEDLDSFRSARNNTEIFESIHGTTFLAIRAAVEVFKRQNLNLEYYNIEVVREGTSIIVIFSDKDRPEGARGSIGKIGFEVELDSRDLHVIRSNYVR